jgi:amino acid transporter
MFMAEELRELRHLPRIIMVFISTCATLYIIICICYDALLPSASIAASSTVALDVVRAKLGTWGITVAGLLFSVSVLGSMNVSLMTGGRLFYSAARSDELRTPLGSLSKTNRTPVWALLQQATAVLALLAMPGSSFNGMVAYFGSALCLWYGVTGGPSSGCAPRYHPPTPPSAAPFHFPSSSLLSPSASTLSPAPPWTPPLAPTLSTTFRFPPLLSSATPYVPLSLAPWYQEKACDLAFH